MPRGVVDKRAIMNLCLAGKQINKLSPQTYPGAQNLIKNVGRSVYIVAKPLVCGAFQLAVSKTKPDGQNIVTEHVFEKQQFRDLLEKMIAVSLISLSPKTRGQINFCHSQAIYEQRIYKLTISLFAGHRSYWHHYQSRGVEDPRSF